MDTCIIKCVTISQTPCLHLGHTEVHAARVGTLTGMVGFVHGVLIDGEDIDPEIQRIARRFALLLLEHLDERTESIGLVHGSRGLKQQ